MVMLRLVLRATFFAQYLLEEVRVGQLRCGGLLQQRFEPLAAFEQAQLAQVLAGSIWAGELTAAGGSASSGRSRRSCGIRSCVQTRCS